MSPDEAGLGSLPQTRVGSPEDARPAMGRDRGERASQEDVEADPSPAVGGREHGLVRDRDRAADVARGLGPGARPEASPALIVGKAEPPGPAHEAGLLDQVVPATLRVAQANRESNGIHPVSTRVTVHLRPPDLGVLRISIGSSEGRLEAHFHSTHPLVHAWLQANAPALRLQLAEAGLVLQDMTLSTSAQGQGWPQAWGHPVPLEATSIPDGRPGVAPIPATEMVLTAEQRMVDCFA